VALAMFAAHHAWLHWPALLGRAPWLARVQAHGLGPLFGGCVLLLVCGQALASFLRGLRRLPPRDPVTLAQDRFRLGAGVLLGIFIVYHLTQVWPSPDGLSATLERSHQRLWEVLGRPTVVCVYVIAASVLAGFLAHGVARVLEPHVPNALRSPLRLLLGLGGFALFVSYLQLIARFAVGASLL
jgi:hypothetical protein